MCIRDSCRSLRSVRSGAAATAIDARTGALWVGGNAGEVQAWRWPPPLVAPRGGAPAPLAAEPASVAASAAEPFVSFSDALPQAGVSAWRPWGGVTAAGGSQPPRGEDETPRASGKKVEEFEAEAAVSDES